MQTEDPYNSDVTSPFSETWISLLGDNLKFKMEPLKWKEARVREFRLNFIFILASYFYIRHRRHLLYLHYPQFSPTTFENILIPKLLSHLFGEKIVKISS